MAKGRGFRPEAFGHKQFSILISLLIFYHLNHPLKSRLGFEKAALILIADSGRKMCGDLLTTKESAMDQEGLDLVSKDLPDGYLVRVQ